MSTLQVITSSSQIPTLAPAAEGWKPATKFNSADQIVHGYQLISKMECPYALSSRIGRVCIGLIILAAPFACFGVVTATVASGCLFALKCVQSFITKEMKTIKFAIKTNLPNTSESSSQAPSETQSEKQNAAYQRWKDHLKATEERSQVIFERLAQLQTKASSKATTDGREHVQAEIKKLQADADAQSKVDLATGQKLLAEFKATLGI